MRVIYRCRKCSEHFVLDSCSNIPRMAQNSSSKAIQVAFITAGCTYVTYTKVLDILGMTAVNKETYMKTIQEMHPIVESMVNEMCEREKERMKAMDQTELGSWSQAVTCADGTWQTRGYHSKNATFSIRNFNNGALLYYKHLCQKGSDCIVKEELYKGTSKSAEGYGAMELFRRAKEEGLQIAVHWQDADSTASKHARQFFPEAEIMICAGKSHLKQLQCRAKQRKFTPNLQKKYEEIFPDVKNVDCHCKDAVKEERTGRGKGTKKKVTEIKASKKVDKFTYKKCRTGCGCLSETFCQRARNSFSNILSTSQSVAEFRRRLRGLVRHVQDQHEWTEEERCDKHDLTECEECNLETVVRVSRRCDFHPLTVCNCGGCADKADHQCVGEQYHTREVLTCPFHKLAYQIECHHRVKMADQLVHSKLLRGHSNWLEGSHNVFIRFRQKHIFVQRLHYHVATNLGFLQANMTHEFTQQGGAYHWKVELFKRMNLPVYDGVAELLEKHNWQRKKRLDEKKTEKVMRRRVELKSLRVKEGQQRKLWSKQHAQDTYGETDEPFSDNETTAGKKQARASRKVCEQCGSDTHTLPTHHLCPKRRPNSDCEDHKGVKQSDQETVSDGDGAADTSLQDLESTDSDLFSYESDMDVFEYDLISGCNCGAVARAHNRGCPLNPRATKSSNAASSPFPYRRGQTEWGSKTLSQPLSQRRVRKNREPLFQPGSYVAVHSTRPKGEHLCCRVVECLKKSVAYMYRLCCLKGVVSELFPETNLTGITSKHQIPLDTWRTTTKITMKAAQSDLQNIDVCNCRWQEAKETVDLTESAASQHKAGQVWIKNSLYILQESDHRIIASPSGWLNDNIIDASQKLLAQHFPLTHGLQPPTLEQIDGFRAHTEDFLQILNIGDNHWIIVSSIGCEKGVVNVYDTYHTELQELPDSTIRTISRLIVSYSPELTIKMIKVDPQKNSNDCGVLCVAIAFDLLSAEAPCFAAYDSKRIRQHLIDCLTQSCFSPFPVTGERSTSDISCLDSMKLDLHCVCRMPEFPGDKMAECESCGKWYHSHCLDIPESVFDSELDERWLCNTCK